MSPITRIGRRIRERRQELGLSLAQVARRVPMTKSNLSRVERGTAGTSLARYEKIARLLGTTLAELTTDRAA